MNQTVKYKWVKRDPEWIKENPNKGTMYKVLDEPEDPIRVELKKQALIAANKSLPIMGIYTIFCEAEKFVYVGQSRDIEVRIRSHKMKITSKDNSAGRTYELIRQHHSKYGMKGFKFEIHEVMQKASSSDLFDCEGKVMIDFVKRGYSLYNRALPAELIQSSVYCPDHLQDAIIKLIRLLSTGKLEVEKVKALMGP